MSRHIATSLGHLTRWYAQLPNATENVAIGHACGISALLGVATSVGIQNTLPTCKPIAVLALGVALNSAHCVYVLRKHSKKSTAQLSPYAAPVFTFLAAQVGSMFLLNQLS